MALRRARLSSGGGGLTIVAKTIVKKGGTPDGGELFGRDVLFTVSHFQRGGNFSQKTQCIKNVESQGLNYLCKFGSKRDNLIVTNE